MVTCKNVQVVGLLRTYQPYLREGWSSHGQAIRLGDVIPWHSRGMRTCGARRFPPGVQSIRRGIGSYFVDIIDVTLYLFLFDRDYVDALTGAGCFVSSCSR